MLSDKHINWLKTGMFEIPVFFSVGFDYKKGLNYFKKEAVGNWLNAFELIEEMYYEDSWGFVSKRTYNNMHYYFFVIKNRFRFDDDNQRCLAHELVHLASFILNDRAIDLFQENECFAYLHTYLMKQCHDILRHRQ